MGFFDALKRIFGGDKEPPFMTVRRADGSVVAMDRRTVEFLNSKAPAPSEESLDRLFAGASQARVIAGGVVDGKATGNDSLLEVTALADLAELRNLLRIGQSGRHCMCYGDHGIEVSGPEGVRATLGLHHGSSIRWDPEWASDAALVDGHRLLEWLAARGVEGPLRNLEADRRRQEEAAKAAERWRRGAPPCLAAIWDELSPRADAGFAMFMPDGGGGASGRKTPPYVSRALGALKDAHPDERDQILALLGWLGAGAGPWSGFPGYEAVAETLLSQYRPASVVAAVEAGEASPLQLRGAARILFRLVDDRETVPPVVRERIRVGLADAPDNLASFDSAFADAPSGKAKELREARERAGVRRRMAQDLVQALAPGNDRAQAGGYGASAEKGQRTVSLFVEEDHSYHVIRFEDRKNAGDRRVRSASEAIAEARKWLGST